MRRPKSRGPFKGAVAVEFALIVPMLFLLFTALLDLGFAAYESMQVQAAAEAGAQYAMKHSWDAAAISAIVVAATSSGTISASPAPAQFCACPSAGGLTQIVCTRTCAGGVLPGQYAQVSAQLTHSTILPYPGLPHPLVLHGRATVRLQ